MKNNDNEFFALDHGLQNHLLYPGPLEKSLIAQMRTKFFSTFTEKRLGSLNDTKSPGSSDCLKPGWMHPAIHGPLSAQVALLQSPILSGQGESEATKPNTQPKI